MGKNKIANRIRENFKAWQESERLDAQRSRSVAYAFSPTQALLSDRERGAVSKLGGVAQPAAANKGRR
jgi:hypothetical protein